MYNNIKIYNFIYPHYYLLKRKDNNVCMTYLNTKSPCSLIGKNDSNNFLFFKGAADLIIREIAIVAQDHSLASERFELSI